MDWGITTWYQSSTACRKPLLLVDVESSVGKNIFNLKMSCENHLRILFTPYLVTLYSRNNLTSICFVPYHVSLPPRMTCHTLTHFGFQGVGRPAFGAPVPLFAFRIIFLAVPSLYPSSTFIPESRVSVPDIWIILATVLFDSGASPSFISVAFAQQNNIPFEELETPLLVTSPGTRWQTKRVTPEVSIEKCRVLK